MPKTKSETITPDQVDADERASYRTGPNVDIGLESGAVTMDPETAVGVAAAAARESNGATTVMTDDGVEEVRNDRGDDPKAGGRGGMADPDAPAVDAKSAAVKAKNPSTIANEPDDIKGDPKADVQ